ncbi:MAG: glycoside hydrolase family 2 protein [Eubacteriales bacterium]|nr:glycoside hydrolase family 2 protein [Eubacteriales bacterium]
MKKQLLRAKWQLCQIGTGDWMDARVPGSVLETLLSHHRVENPYYGKNEYKVREEFRKDYQYRCVFTISEDYAREEQIDLVFYCLDTLAEIFVNGKKAGQACNMHRTWRFSIKELIHSGENVMEIFFCSPIQFVESYVPEENRKITMVNTGTMYGSQYLRKAHSMFGWDWGAQLPDIGILRPVELQAYSGARIAETEILQRHEKGKVKVTVRTILELFSEEAYQIKVQLTSPDGQITAAKADKDGNVDFTVEHPQLWWPVGYGEQPLYQVQVLLEQQGECIESRDYTIGLRTITVSQDRDEWGSEFALTVNGVKIFTKGANYIPEDCIYPWITKKRLEELVDAALFANFNCLRIWGGGYYPGDDFYDLCDRKGILLWQDLMYACNIYDLNPEFIQNIEEETRDNVKRLRHHACLALWCGNNEMETAWLHWAETKNHPLSLKRDYLLQFEYILPKIVGECDKQTFYWPSSPSSGGSFDDPDSENRGDAHYWEIWHGQKPFSDYRKHYFRFCSEFGFQSFPSMKTICSFAEEEERNIFSEVMESHQKNPAANGKILYYLSENFRYPKDLPSLVYISQLMQGMAMKTGIDHWRRNRGRCMGSLYWQFNDNWPVASWSSVDYYGRYKALHYMAARFYAPLAGSIKRDGSCIEAWAENETQENCTCQVQMLLQTLNFTVLYSEANEVDVPALSSVRVMDRDFAELISGRENQVFVQCVFVFDQKGEKKRSTETELFVPFKYLKLRKPDLKAELAREDGEYRITLTSDTFTPFVNIDFGERDAILSDNFFSVTAPEKYVVTIKSLREPENPKKSLEEDLILQTVQSTY